MRRAITTRYFGPTNHRGSRIQASAEAGSIIVEYSPRLNPVENHTAAAVALATKLAWWGTWYGGDVGGSGYVFVLATDPFFVSPAATFTVEK